ncbi:MAG: aspartyl protease family protein [Anaerolineae bacterium]
MLLTFPDKTVFATGVIDYWYQPATDWERTPRILVPIQIAHLPVTAMIDTGAPYVVCTPEVARNLALDPADAMEPVTLSWHGRLTGHLHLLPVTLQAVQGDSLLVEATTFVPDVSSVTAWERQRRPFVIGLGCLAKMRFALDPNDDSFYFGPL